MLRLSASCLSTEDLDHIHGAALEVLRDVGVRVDHERMRDLLHDHGALLDGDVARFPEGLVEDVVSLMRDPARQDAGYTGVLPLNWDRIPRHARVVPVATGQATMAHDLDTDDLRPATTADLVMACRLLDNLPGVVTGHPLYLPQDRPPLLRDLCALVTVAQHYPYSDFVEIFSPQTVPYFGAAGRVICGSEEARRQTPPVSSWGFATPPLQVGRHGFEIVFGLKDAGIERGYGVAGSMPVLGVATPMTIAGHLVVQTAEVLAANVMNWALTGRTCGYCGGPTVLDMRLMTPSQGGPEATLLLLACVDLQRYYGNSDPVFPYALGTDAKYPDVQAGMEKAIKATLAVASGSRLLSAGLGCLTLSGAVSLAQVLIDYELCRYLEHVLRGFVVDPDRLSLDLIRQVGIGGTFVAEAETVSYMRETLYFPELLDRRAPAQWQRDRIGMAERAKLRVREILARDEQPTYLDRAQVAELERILAKAQALV